MRLGDKAWFWGFLTTLGSLVLLDVGIATKQGPDWWAAWGQWVGGVGSIAAAGAAVWIAVIGWQKSDKATREQMLRLDETQMREHASKFAFWVRHTEDPRAMVMFHNGAPLPMYEVEMQLSIGGNPVTPWIALEAIGPTTGPQEHSAASALVQQTIKLALRNLDERARQDESLFRSIPLEVEMSERSYIMRKAGVTTKFRDANNHQWIRTVDGKLSINPDGAE